MNDLTKMNWLVLIKVPEVQLKVVTLERSEYFHTSVIQSRIPLIGPFRSFLSNGVKIKYWHVFQ